MSGFSKVTVPLETILPSALEFLREGTPVLLPVKGNSMLPFIRGGKDLVLVSNVAEVKVGDVVLARTTAGNYVIHRVIGEEPGLYVLKGDGNLVGTEKCALVDVIGTVTEVRKPSGRVFNPASVKNWQKLPLFLRRVVLALYKLIYRP